MDPQHLDRIQMAMVGIFGLAVLLNVVALGFAAIFMGKALKIAREYGDDVRDKVEPVLRSSYELIEQTRALMAKIEPKLESAAGDLADIARAAREETNRLSSSVDEVTDRLRRQAERMDSMTTNALNGIERVGHFLNEAVSAPARQISGVVAAARAVVSHLRNPASRQPNPDEQVQEERQHYV
ncbi:MAG TPA: hypothetical protein VGJ21_23735 [Terracidiphilus sp.]|jgi:methyl-accepting chemotaxis protein